MRLPLVAALAVLPWMAHAAPTWQTVSAEPGKRIELDRTSIKREGDRVQAVARVVLDKGITDLQSGGIYRVIEAVTRYECATRNAATLKRIYKKDETETLREEDIKGGNLPIRTGTLDDKVLREVCRPAGARGEAMEVANKASAAATKLRAANEALIRQELARAQVVRTSTHGEALPRSAPDRAPTRRTKHESQAEQAARAHADIHWSYEGEGGPQHWHRLDARNQICATGNRQSPIDIRDGIRVDLEPIKFDYRPSNFHIIDNGHTVQVAVAGGSITLTGKTYELKQFHFHKPSEEKVAGKQFDMVAHFVHQSSDGRLAVVAVLLEKGAENATVQTLWNYIPLEKNLPVSPPAATIDLNAFLPKERGYYTYMGSLTTPPCSEGVLWLVMKQPVPISAEQLDIFSRLYPNNARPIQPTANRLIKEGR